jgi:hypothetical protein
MPDARRIHAKRQTRRRESRQSHFRARLALPAAMFTAAAFIAAVLVSPSGHAFDMTNPGKDWTEAYRKNNLVIFTKDIGHAYEILAVSELEVAPEVIFDVLRDFEHYPEFMPYVQESRVLSRINDLDLITYARVAPPFVSERDYSLHVRMTRGSRLNGGVFKLEWTAAPEARAEVAGVVRVKLNDGSWIAEPMDGGKHTRLSYRVLTNPGGLIPSFAVNWSHTVSIPELFEAVRKRAEQSPVR